MTANALQALERSPSRAGEEQPALSGAEGRLILRAQLRFSTLEEPYAWLQLADTGPGIPAKDLARLFDPFFSTKGEEEKSGLGLSLVRALVLKNEGQITASSFEGEGTTFTLQFPLAGPAQS